MSMKEEIFNYEKKKKNFERLRKKERKQVFNCMEYNISLQKCNKILKELMIIIILQLSKERNQNKNFQL